MNLSTLNRFAILLFAAVVGVGGGACSKTPPATDAGQGGATPAKGEYAKLVGNWEGSEKPVMTVNGKKVEAQGDPIFFKIEFKADGVMTMTMPIFEIPIKGTWKGTKSEGNKFTIDTVLEMPSFGFEAKTVDGKTTQKEEITTKKEQDTFTVVFETPDRIVMTAAKEPDQPMTLQRKK